MTGAGRVERATTLAEMVDVSYENFEEVVLSSERPVVAYFWHPLCAPCMQMKPHLNRLIQEYADRFRFASYNVLRYAPFRRGKVKENVRYAREECGMETLATLILYHDGEEIQKSVCLTEKDIRDFLDGGLREIQSRVTM